MEPDPISEEQEGVFLSGTLPIPCQSGDSFDLGAFVKNLVRGECPFCRRRVRMVEVGCCVYGVCGHRLFQGYLKGGARDRAERAGHGH